MNPLHNCISSFYEDSNLFITGVTGFLGKVLVEKLLRSCEGVGTIYVLIKAKKELSPEQRLKEVLRTPIFDKLRDTSPDIFKKVRVVEGDIEHPGLGLTEKDRKTLAESVNVVVHSAASVHFGRGLSGIVMTNIFGTENVAELCKSIKHLKCFVYVSTAYSQIGREEIEEVVYEPPFEVSVLKECATKLPPNTLKAITKQLLGNHISTYTFSKQFAEKLVSQYASFFPTVIIRPSIINSTWKEPFPGWLDSYGGTAGVVKQSGLGFLRQHYTSGRDVCDLIPVDVVVNTIITAAWYNSTNRSSTARVYNCCSGQINSLTWDGLLALAMTYARMHPSTKVLRYPRTTTVNNRLLFDISYFVNDAVPAFCYDAVLRCMGRESKVLKYTSISRENFLLARFATDRTFNLRTTEFRKLTEAIKKARDGTKFDVDMRSSNGFSWDSYIENYILGIRQHLLKDHPTTVQQARTKLRRLYWTRNVARAAMVTTAFATTLSLGNALL